MAELHGLQQQHKQKKHASKCTQGMNIRKHCCARARDDRLSRLISCYCVTCICCMRPQFGRMRSYSTLQERAMIRTLSD
eukprot:366250-Chlamydomonas_euryale.AAC.1